MWDRQNCSGYSQYSGCHIPATYQPQVEPHIGSPSSGAQGIIDSRKLIQCLQGRGVVRQATGFGKYLRPAKQAGQAAQRLIRRFIGILLPQEIVQRKKAACPNSIR